MLHYIDFSAVWQELIAKYWDDMTRIAASLKLGTINPTNLIRMLQIKVICDIIFLPTKRVTIRVIRHTMGNVGITRFEEISRCASEVQDALISILSEKSLAIPELGFELSAIREFSCIATANTLDRVVNEMSAAL